MTKAAIILKKTAAATMCVILAAGMTACGKKTDSAQSESVSENDKYSSDIFAMDTYMSLTAYGAKAEDAEPPIRFGMSCLISFKMLPDVLLVASGFSAFFQ